MATDSLKKRYLYRVLSNLVGAAISLVTEAIIPRGLGPRAYGNFSYLSSFFSQIIGFLEMGTSTGFYTKLSKRQTDLGLVSFYISFTGLVCFNALIFVVFVHSTDIYMFLLPDQDIFYIYLAAVWGILTWLIYILNSMIDAYGLTVSAEITKIIQKGLGLALILALFFADKLNLTNYFYYQYFILLLLACVFIWIIEYKKHLLPRNWLLSWNKIKRYTREFYEYCHPLFVLASVGLIVGLIDRWILQRFGGSVEQGFYGLSQKIGAACFLFTGAMTQLITREFAIAFDKNDIHEMARLFRRYIPILYAISAYFACFIAVQASKVTYIMGGENFHQATYAVMIMAFYPIHQVYGQLSASVFFASGQTGLFRNICIIFSVIGLPLSYFLIAPEDKMGLNAGALGMAIKMVVLQFITVNVLLYFNAHLLGLRFWRYFGHQVVCMSALLILSLMTAITMNHVLIISDRVLISFVISGIVYSILAAGLLIIFPIVFGLNRNDLRNLNQALFKSFFPS